MFERRFLSDVARQFRSLNTRGDRIAVCDGFTRDFRDKRYSIFHKKGGLHNHFQGIGRIGNHLFVTGSMPHRTARADLFVFQLGSRASDPGPWGSNLMRNRIPAPNDTLIAYHEIDATLWHAGSFTLLDTLMIVPLEGTQIGSVVAQLDLTDPSSPVRIAGRDIARPDNKAGVCAATPLPGGHVLLAVWTDSDPPDAGDATSPFHLDLYISDAPASTEKFELAGRFEPAEDHALHRQFQSLDFVWQKSGTGEKLFLIGFENTSPVQPHPTDPGENRAYLFEVTLPDAWLTVGTPTANGGVLALTSDFAVFITARVLDNAADWFNMDAGACAYVDSNQQLVVYAVHHFLNPLRGRATGDVLAFKCVEFRASDFADLVDRIEDAWVELCEDVSGGGRRLSLLGPFDSSIEDTRRCFVEDEPFELVQSVRFQIPADRAFVAYTDRHFAGDGALVLRGDGTRRELDLAATPFAGAIRACRFLPFSTAAALPGAIVV